MLVQFNKNIQFTKLVKADGRLREFNFRRVNGLQEGLFTVDVSDDRGNRIMFRMEQKEGKWRIQDQPLLYWVKNSEPAFHDLIEEERRMS